MKGMANLVAIDRQLVAFTEQVIYSIFTWPWLTLQALLTFSSLRVGHKLELSFTVFTVYLYS